jgi:hypothetical protein
MEENLDLEASDRFLLNALRSADSVVQQRALRLLGHESWEDRDENLKEANERISLLSREVEHQRQCAREAERQADQWQQNSYQANGYAQKAMNDADNQRRRANEFQEVLQRLQGQLGESCVDIGEVLGAWDDD